MSTTASTVETIPNIIRGIDTIIEPLVLSPNTVAVNLDINSQEGSIHDKTTSKGKLSSKKQQLTLHPSSVETCSLHSTCEDGDCDSCHLPPNHRDSDDLDDCVEHESSRSARTGEDEIGCLSFHSSSSHSSSASSGTNKRVRFSPMVGVKDTLSHRDMSLKEHYDYWLQDHEFLMIKYRNQCAIQYFEHRLQLKEEREQQQQSSLEDNSLCHNHLCDNDGPDCLRGLESGLSHENLRRRSYRFASYEEVLLEQDDQYYAGIYDDIAIAEVYFEVTVECRFRAQYRAMQDKKEIESYLLNL